MRQKSKKLSGILLSIAMVLAMLPMDFAAVTAYASTSYTITAKNAYIKNETTGVYSASIAGTASLTVPEGNVVSIKYYGNGDFQYWKCDNYDYVSVHESTFRMVAASDISFTPSTEEFVPHVSNPITYADFEGVNTFIKFGLGKQGEKDENLEPLIISSVRLQRYEDSAVHSYPAWGVKYMPYNDSTQSNAADSWDINWIFNGADTEFFVADRSKYDYADGETLTVRFNSIDGTDDINTWTNAYGGYHKSYCGIRKCVITANFGHDWDNGTVTKEATHTSYGIKTYTCQGCGQTTTTRISKIAEHTFSSAWTSDDTNHWHACECGQKSDVAVHTYVKNKVLKEATHTEEGAIQYKCSVCGKTKTEVIPKITEHTFSSEWTTDVRNHWHACECGEKSDVATHTYLEDKVLTQPTHTEPGTMQYKCSVCGAIMTASIPTTDGHDFGDEVFGDEFGHYHECECGEKDYFEDHTYTTWNELDEYEEYSICDICGYEGTRYKLSAYIGVEGGGEDENGNPIGYVGWQTWIFIEASGGSEEYTYEFFTLDGDEWVPLLNEDGTAIVEPFYEFVFDEEGEYTYKAIVTDSEGTVYETEPVKITVTCEHCYGDMMRYDEHNHWFECVVCGDKQEVGEHVFGEWKEPDENFYYENGFEPYNNLLYRKCESCEYYEVKEKEFTASLTFYGSEEDTEVQYGDVIFMQVSAEGGSGQYVYSYKMFKDGEWTVLQDAYGDIYERPIEVIGNVIFVAEVTDSNGNRIETNQIHVTVLHEHDFNDYIMYDENGHWHECICGEKTDIQPHNFGDWFAGGTTTDMYIRICEECGYTETKMALSASLNADIETAGQVIESGTKMTLVAEASGGSGEYTYTFEMYKDNEGWVVIRENSSEPTFETVTLPGNKPYKVIVTDSDGDEATAYIEIYAIEHIHDFGNSWSCDETNHWFECRCGEKEQLEAHTFTEWEVSAAAAGMEYRRCEVCGYSERRMIEESLTAILGVSGLDAAIVTGNTIGLTGYANGGSGNYTYKFAVLNVKTGKWTILSDFTSSNESEFKAESEGEYQFALTVKDSNGKTASAQRVTVNVEKKPEQLVGKLTINDQADEVTVQEGNSLTLKVTATGGSESYTYKYAVLDVKTGKWTILKDFGRETEYTYKADRQGTYQFAVTVKDSTGKTVAANRVTVNVEEKAQELAGTLIINNTSERTTVEAGSRLMLNVAAVGGTGSYTYKYAVLNETTGKWTILKDFRTDSSYVYEAEEEGTYQFAVTVKDSSGKTVAANRVAVDVEKTGELSAKLTINGEAEKVTVQEGSSQVLKVEAAGGSKVLFGTLYRCTFSRLFSRFFYVVQHSCQIIFSYFGKLIMVMCMMYPHDHFVYPNCISQIAFSADSKSTSVLPLLFAISRAVLQILLTNLGVPFEAFRIASVAFSSNTGCRQPAASSFFFIYVFPSSFVIPSMW